MMNLPDERQLRERLTDLEGNFNQLKLGRANEEILKKHQKKLDEIKHKSESYVLRIYSRDKQELIKEYDGRIRKVDSRVNSVSGHINEMKRKIEGLKRKYAPEQRGEAKQDIMNFSDIVEDWINKLVEAIEKLEELVKQKIFGIDQKKKTNLEREAEKYKYLY